MILLLLFHCIVYEQSIVQHLKRDDWYMWANMKKGGITLPLFTSLDAYWPGIQVIYMCTCASMYVNTYHALSYAQERELDGLIWSGRHQVEKASVKREKRGWFFIIRSCHRHWCKDYRKKSTCQKIQYSKEKMNTTPF